jgi:hypothetical protein
MKVEKNKIFKYFLNILPILIIVVFFILNHLTPMIADDFSYSFIFGTEERITSISDIIISQYDHYMNWGGRSVALFFAQLFLFIGEQNIFNIVNTIVYCVFILLMQFHITGSLKKINPVLFSVNTALLWFLLPAYGQNCLWLTGSCVYLWTTTFILLFLVPFRKKHDNPNFKLTLPLSILLFFLGILVGWSVENSGAAVLFLLIAYFIMKIVNKDKVALFEVVGSVGFLIGFCLLLSAPGNSIRINQEFGFAAQNSFIIRLMKRFAITTMVFIQNNGFLLTSLSVWFGYDVIFHQKRKLNLFTWFYFVAGLAGAYSMVLSPFFPDRACFVFIVFLTITVLNLLTQLKWNLPEIIKRNIPILSMIVVTFFSFSLIMASRDIAITYIQLQNRYRYIQTQKEKGISDVEVSAPIPAWDKHNALSSTISGGPNDIDNQFDSWQNKAIADYFGINSIKGIQPTISSTNHGD